MNVQTCFILNNILFVIIVAKLAWRRWQTQQHINDLRTRLIRVETLLEAAKMAK
jgi:hypothetical protein